jgi:hypothetical protein
VGQNIAHATEKRRVRRDVRVLEDDTGNTAHEGNRGSEGRGFHCPRGSQRVVSTS